MINNIPEEAKKYAYWIIIRNMEDGSFNYHSGCNNLYDALHRAGDVNGEVVRN